MCGCRLRSPFNETKVDPGTLSVHGTLRDFDSPPAESGNNLTTYRCRWHTKTPFAAGFTPKGSPLKRDDCPEG